MKIHVYGLGYVGTVTVACLANEGQDVVGIDIDKSKVDIINSGKSPVVEKGLNEKIAEAIKKEKLTAISNGVYDLTADLSLVCVGTPSRENGSLSLDAIKRVAQQIGDKLKASKQYHVVTIRSTMLPGTTEDVIIPILEQRSGKRIGVDFGVCVNPEFLREGSSLRDYFNPPYTLIGQYDQRSGDLVEQIYTNISAPVIRTSIQVAEMLKYVNNSFHALKISFANEIGNFCKKLGIDSHEVMELFCKDTKLNISPRYLKPGFAFGGSCLHKDLSALLYKSKEIDLDLPLLSSILLSNDQQLEIAFNLIKNTGKKKIGVLGLSFKPGTDDLRKSPMVDLTEKLIGKGYDVNLYDSDVALAKIYGANKIYIENVIPHVSSLMKSTIEEVIQNSEVIVICHKNQEIKNAIVNLNHNKIIIDLARIIEKPEEKEFYEGICW